MFGTTSVVLDRQLPVPSIRKSNKMKSRRTMHRIKTIRTKLRPFVLHANVNEPTSIEDPNWIRMKPSVL